MVDAAKFKPKTVYVTYIAATPEKVWQALTDPEFSKRYFFGFAVHVEPRTGGAFRILYPDGRVHGSGEVVEWSPPRRLSCTWLISGMPPFDGLPECIVTYDIAPSGEAVRLTMTESHARDDPDDILAGGRSGWPAILSNLKSLLDTGKTMTLGEEGPPPGMIEAAKKAAAEKPWLKR
jgi:uncharacterized protein YndB with AHSA1/START domain